MEQLEQTEIDQLIPLATDVIAKHSISGTPEDLIRVAHDCVYSKLNNLVREHREKYDPNFPPPEHDSAESLLRQWLQIDDLMAFYSRGPSK